LLRDGDKPGTFFLEISESVFPVKRKDNPPARRSRPSWPRWSRKVNATIKIYAVRTVSGGGRKERKGEKTSSEAKTAKSAKSIKIYAVWTVSGGNCVERKVKPSSKAKTAKLAKNTPVWTVSDGGWVERKERK
jgi:hypothetical protein